MSDPKDPGPASSRADVSPPAGLYAVAYAALRATDGTGREEVRVTAEVIRAEDDVQALDIGLRRARHALPPADRWSGHSVVVQSAANVLPPEEEWA